MSVNKVILVGRLGADPEIRYTLEGKPVATMRIATNEVINRGGTKETLTEWHRVVAFGRLAEICGEYLKVGTQVYLEGRLRTRKFEDKEGRERYITEVVAINLKILDRRENSNKASEFENREGKSKPAKEEPIDLSENFSNFEEDDLPF
ncbi:MAG: single-stranded DNA-binding protein [Thermodesulfobacterium sp.]|jgi:single-strand DNA-binding protein|nr:single-stranded DNA-binding protein [Thermodesulfobacterium sp.]